MTAAEERAQWYYEETTKRDTQGRFIVRIPFIDGKIELGDSQALARNRFFQLERRLGRDSSLRAKYNEFMNEYLELGHMREATIEEQRAKGYYIPHHPVTKKFRVVFDASCATTNGKSVNDIQLAGPNLQEKLAFVIMRFRFHKHVFATDVRKMFRQFKMHPDDLAYQKIFWRLSEQEPLKTYVLLTVTYGMKCSPFLAIRTMLQLAREYKDDYPLAALATELERYVDDYFTGADNEETIVNLYKQLCEMLSKAGLELGKWKTNCPLLAEKISADFIDQSDSVDMNDDMAAVLGLKWIPSSDMIVFHVNQSIMSERKITKRFILSAMGKLYDPNGYLNPTIVVGKIIMQKLWDLQVGWDDELCDTVKNEWKNFYTGLPAINHVKIPRWLQTNSNKHVELIGFADASQRAYGAVIYVRCYENDRIWCTLLTSRSRVAPLKQNTIPRLELCAAEVLANLMSDVRRECRIMYAPYYLFSDSTIVLQWIKQDASTNLIDPTSHGHEKMVSHTNRYESS